MMNFTKALEELPKPRTRRSFLKMKYNLGFGNSRIMIFRVKDGVPIAKFDLNSPPHAIKHWLDYLNGYRSVTHKIMPMLHETSNKRDRLKNIKSICNNRKLPKLNKELVYRCSMLWELKGADRKRREQELLQKMKEFEESNYTFTGAGDQFNKIKRYKGTTFRADNYFEEMDWEANLKKASKAEDV